MKIHVSKHSGFCFGVKRAVNLTSKALSGPKKNTVYSLGPLIHNKFVVSDLSKKGLKIVRTFGKKGRGLYVIPSHGIDPSLVKKKKGTGYIDTTCPFVFKARELIRKLCGLDYTVLILGDRNHPEVKGLRAISNGKAHVVANKKEAAVLNVPGKKIALISQTTQSPENLNFVASRLLEKDFDELRIFNTICNDVINRQKEAKKVAARSDLVLVIGGKNSANTKRLADLCAKLTRTRHIESDKEIRKSWLKNVKHLGIVTGASTPGEFISRVKRKII